jgi:hypoxia up-regulated 1
MGEAAATAENLIDGIDAPLKLTRDELGALCAEPLARLRELLDGVLSTALLAESPLDAVEVLGGGCRMPIVQKVLAEALGAAPCAAALADKPLGAKLDDSHRVLMTTDDH